MGIALDHSNANNADTQKAIKTYQAQIRAAATKLDDEQRAKELARDTLVAAEKKAAAKRKIESEMQTLNADLDGMSAEAKVCSEKASKAMVDAAKLADELRAEQEAALVLSKARKLADVQVKDLQT